MARPSDLDVLLTLVGTRTDGPVDGSTLTRRLTSAGHPVPPSTLLTRLVALEASGHVEIGRDDGYQFALTARGEDAAYALGPGDPIDVVLVMVDLVGFVAFTVEAGDAAAHRTAHELQQRAETALLRAGGKLVKALGDGFIGTVRSPADGVATVQTLARQCVRPDGQPWPVRAAVHRGRPIAYHGDLFGADVNLAARLCTAAQPGEIVMTTSMDDPRAELLDVRGLAEPIWITRVAVP